MEYIANLQKTKKIAQDFAKTVKIGDYLCLIGDLGSGKTEFAKHFIQSICGNETIITSPTFNILNIYDDKIAHFDLYRLENATELEEIGFQEILEEHISIIEWPQIAMEFLPENAKTISFEILENEQRKITVK